MKYLLFFALGACASAPQTESPASQKGPLYKIVHANAEQQEIIGFVNAKGDTIIPMGKYNYAYTDTIIDFGIVLHPQQGWIGINAQDQKLFQIFQYDNGPDYVEEGLFRIVAEGKIGYANTKGEIVIAPQFKCAYPFEGGKAKVSLNCQEENMGDVNLWTGNDWFFINAKGEKVE
jgi:hypothetical protein